MYLGDFATASTVHHKFTTVDSTGAPVALSSAAVVTYRNASTVQSATGVTLTVSFDTVTGLNHLQVDMAGTSTHFLATGHYSAIISSGGAGGENLAGYVVAEWSINRKPAVQVTTAVSISTASLISTSQSIATIGSLPADSSLASVVEWDGSTVPASTLVDTVNLTTAAAVQINAEADAAIETYNLDHLLGANGSSVNVAEGSLWARMTSSASAYTFKSSLHSLAVLEDEINAVYGSSVVTLDSTLVEAANFSTAGLETASSLVAVVEWNGSTVPASTLVDMVNMTTAAAVQVNDEVADVINTDTHAEPGRGTVPPAAPSLSGMVRHLYFPMRHSFDIHSSGRIFRDSSGGVAWVKPLTDAGSTYVEGLATTAT